MGSLASSSASQSASVAKVAGSCDSSLLKALSSGSPGLIGLLGSWSAIEVRPTRPDWALHWSAWLGPLDAIALRGALPAITQATMAVAPRTAQKPDLGHALQQLRGDLAGFIRRQPARQAPAPLRGPGVAQAVPEPLEDADYGSYRQRYLDIQRRMELRIGPLRQHCREVLARTSPRLSQLAKMDAMLEDMLGERAQALLARLSALLERRFHHYRQDAARSMAAFEQDFQDALMAELHFRLEPVTGLVEAWQTGA